MTIVGAPAAQACTATTAVTSNLGSYSPPAAAAGAIPALRSDAGLSCVPSVIVLLGMNYINATFSSANVLKLKRDGGTETIAYTASADPGRTVPFVQNTTVDYMQNNLLDLLGLLNASTANFPFYVKPTAGASPPIGTYRDVVTIKWNWYLCQGISAIFLCIGTPNKGTATTIITVTMDVAAKGITVSTNSVTTWDPLNGTVYPKALPGSRRRTTIGVTNPDIVPLTSNSLMLNLPIERTQRLALDGDGTLFSPVFGFSEGSPASALSFAYQSPGSTTDDVEFSNDNGASWVFAPVAGDTVSQAAVTNIRLKPKGAMAPGSSFSVSVPLMVK